MFPEYITTEAAALSPAAKALYDHLLTLDTTGRSHAYMVAVVNLKQFGRDKKEIEQRLRFFVAQSEFKPDTVRGILGDEAFSLIETLKQQPV